MLSTFGRFVRIAVGGAFILVGLLVVQGPASTTLVSLGLLPLAAGLFNVSLLVPSNRRAATPTRYCTGRCWRSWGTQPTESRSGAWLKQCRFRP